MSAGPVYVAFANEPGFWLFPSVFGDTFGQHAFQSVWMGITRRPDCPVCGPPGARVDPMEHAPPGASARRLQALWRRRLRRTSVAAGETVERRPDGE